jgi:hypothetical protein
MALNAIIVQNIVRKGRVHSSLKRIIVRDYPFRALRENKLFENKRETVLAWKEKNHETIKMPAQKTGPLAWKLPGQGRREASACVSGDPKI